MFGGVKWSKRGGDLKRGLGSELIFLSRREVTPGPCCFCFVLYLACVAWRKKWALRLSSLMVLGIVRLFGFTFRIVGDDSVRVSIGGSFYFHQRLARTTVTGSCNPYPQRQTTCFGNMIAVLSLHAQHVIHSFAVCTCAKSTGASINQPKPINFFSFSKCEATLPFQIVTAILFCWACAWSHSGYAVNNQ